jgi:hypothetical protein
MKVPNIPVAFVLKAFLAVIVENPNLPLHDYSRISISFAMILNVISRNIVQIVISKSSDYYFLHNQMKLHCQPIIGKMG